MALVQHGRNGGTCSVSALSWSLFTAGCGAWASGPAPRIVLAKLGSPGPVCPWELHVCVCWCRWPVSTVSSIAPTCTPFCRGDRLHWEGDACYF